MTLNPRRSWLVRALFGHPLARRVDRLEAFAAVMTIVVLAIAALIATDVRETVYAERSQSIAAEAAARHPVEATAVDAARGMPSGPAKSVPVNYTVPVEWFAQSTTHNDVVTVNHPVAKGERLPVWVDGAGHVTKPPQPAASADVDANGLAILFWLLCAGAVVGVAAAVRNLLTRRRYREWDQDLVLLIGGGGSSTHKA
jgi:hypothetical protein